MSVLRQPLTADAVSFKTASCAAAAVRLMTARPTNSLARTPEQGEESLSEVRLEPGVDDGVHEGVADAQEGQEAAHTVLGGVQGVQEVKQLHKAVRHPAHRERHSHRKHHFDAAQVLFEGEHLRLGGGGVFPTGTEPPRDGGDLRQLFADGTPQSEVHEDEDGGQQPDGYSHP